MKPKADKKESDAMNEAEGKSDAQANQEKKIEIAVLKKEKAELVKPAPPAPAPKKKPEDLGPPRWAIRWSDTKPPSCAGGKNNACGWEEEEKANA